MKSIADILRSIGFTENEVVIYLALAEGGTAPASEIAKITRLPRSTVQFTCQQLQRKGVISLVKRKNMFLFSLDDSRRLLTLLELQKQSLVQKQEDVHRIITELENMRRPESALPSVRFHEGVEGIAAGWQSILELVPDGGTICSYAHPLDTGTDPVSPLLSTFVKQRLKRNVTSHVIACDSATSYDLQKNDHKALRETRIMTGRCCRESAGETMFFGSRICIISTKSELRSAVIVENAHIAALHQTAFDALWQTLPAA